MRNRCRPRRRVSGAGRRAEDVYDSAFPIAARARAPSRELARRRRARLLVHRVDPHERHARERRVAELAAIDELALGEAGDVVLRART